ncbi:MAG: cysteine rich repeat-containing protein [Bacteroidota bacterium]
MTRNLLLSAFATSLLLSNAAAAQTPENQGQGMMAACRAELGSLCQNVEAGHGRKLGCLAENKTKLGAECAAALETRLAQKSDASGQQLKRPRCAAPAHGRVPLRHG